MIVDYDGPSSCRSYDIVWDCTGNWVDVDYETGTYFKIVWYLVIGVADS